MSTPRWRAGLALALTMAAIGLLVLLSSISASAESIDIYEFEELTSDYGGNAVAVNGDGSEAVILWSEYNKTSRLYTNYVLTTSGTSVTERERYDDQSWQWTCAAWNPSGSTALLGGTSGRLYTYSQGTVRSVGLGVSYTIYSMDWHPTDGYAYIGTSSSYIYMFRSGTVSREFSLSSSTKSIDFRDDGGEVAFSSYYYVHLLNTSGGGNPVQLDRPVGDDEEWYYCHALEYNKGGSALLCVWQDWRSSYALFRYDYTRWNELGTVANPATDIVFEVEGTFALITMPNNLQETTGGKVNIVADWYTTGATYTYDADFCADGFYFLVGTDMNVLKFKRKPNVKPWMTSPIPDLAFDEDDPDGGDDLLDLFDYISDDRFREKLRFEFDYQQDDTVVKGTIDGHYVDFQQLVGDWNGKMSFRIKVWDRGFDDVEGSLDDKFNRTNLFNVTVRSVNDPMSLVSVGGLVVGVDNLVFFTDEGSWLNLSVVVADVDEDEPRFSFNRTLPSLKVDKERMTLSFHPANRDVGTLHVNLTVSDGRGSSDYANMVFHVRNVNNPPRLGGVKDRTVEEDSWLNFTVWATDDDLNIGVPDVLTFSTNRTDGAGDDDLPNFSFMVDPEDATRIRVSFLPTNEDVGEVEVEFRVRDGFAAGGSWQDVGGMTIKVLNTNDAPVITEINGVSPGHVQEYDLFATEDLTLSVELAAHDDDGDTLTYYVDNPRFHLEQPGMGLEASLTFTPENSDVGNLVVVVSVWDTHSTFDELELNITISNENDPPVIISFEAMDATDQVELSFELYEDVTFQAPVRVADIDSDDLAYSDTEDLLEIAVDPDDPFRATATFTPDQSMVGTVQTTLEVSDGDGGSDVLNLVFTINPVNDDPMPATASQLGGEASLTIQLKATGASDPDGDALTYVWDFGDHSAPVSGEDLTQVSHTYPRPGVFVLTLTVEDGNGGSASSTAEVLVPEVEEGPSDVEVEEGPVGLFVGLTVVFVVLALAMLYVYWNRPRRP